MKSKAEKMRKKLEVLAEEGREVMQKAIDNSPEKDMEVVTPLNGAYSMYIQGINRAYRVFCEEFGISYQPIKLKELHS